MSLINLSCGAVKLIPFNSRPLWIAVEAKHRSVSLGRLVSLFTAVMFAVPAVAAARPVDPWQTWENLTKKMCPTHHVQWVLDGGYDSLIGDFVETLPQNVSRKVSLIANYAHRCASEQSGFSCEMSVHLDAFNRLNLMNRFAAFGCRNVACEEPALCSRFPR